MIVKDASVLIHLAKITILEKSCEFFKEVIVPHRVYEEVLAGEGKGYGDVEVIMELVKMRKVIVKEVKEEKLVERAESFNIQGGEAEAVALYWQEKADYLATDDDNVRKKVLVLGVKLVGTPSIMLKLFRGKKIDEKKYLSGIFELRKIGWFSNAVIDKLRMEVNNGKTNRNKAA